MNYREFRQYLMLQKPKKNSVHSDNANPSILLSKSMNSKDYRYNHGQFRTLLLLLILLFSGIAMILVKADAKHNKELQTGIAEEIIRFHVIANSDSEADQALKLTVKSTLVEKLSPYLKDAKDIIDARNILEDKLLFIEQLSEEAIRTNGYNYSVKVSLEKTFFPLKIYGDYTFPQGYYEALRVQIGDAEGKNWWCVMFPPLCFVDETYGIIDEASKEKLEYLLTEEEYEALFQKKTPIKVKFKLWETLKKLLKNS